MHRRLAWALVVGMAAGSAACGGDRQQTAVELIAQAPDAVRELRTARFTYSSENNFNGEMKHMNGDGAIDFVAQRWILTMASDSPEPIKLTQVLEDGRVLYLVPESRRAEIGGKSWIAVAIPAGKQPQIDPQSQVEFLSRYIKEGATATDVGEDEIRGTRATHFRVTRPVTTSTHDSGTSTSGGFDIDVWLTKDGIPLRMNISAGSDDSNKSTGQFELFDLGEPVDIPAPDDGDILVADQDTANKYLQGT